MKFDRYEIGRRADGRPILQPTKIGFYGAQPIGAVTDGSVPQPEGATLDAKCIVCDEPAGYLILGSYRCVSHQETTVVGKPSAPGEAVILTFNVKHYTDCIEGHCRCGGDGK